MNNKNISNIFTVMYFQIFEITWTVKLTSNDHWISQSIDPCPFPVNTENNT